MLNRNLQVVIINLFKVKHLIKYILSLTKYLSIWRLIVCVIWYIVHLISSLFYNKNSDPYRSRNFYLLIFNVCVMEIIRLCQHFIFLPYTWTEIVSIFLPLRIVCCCVCPVTGFCEQPAHALSNFNQTFFRLFIFMNYLKHWCTACALYHTAASIRLPDAQLLYLFGHLSIILTVSSLMLSIVSSNISKPSMGTLRVITDRMNEWYLT